MSERGPSAELRRARRRIDAIDRRIVRLLNERARLGLEAGAAKARHGRAVRDAAREEDVLRRIGEANDGPLPSDVLRALYRRIMAATRRLESVERRGGTPGHGGQTRRTDQMPEPEPDAGSPRG